MLATRIIAVRHGETAWNVDTRIQGQQDIVLNAKGLWQAQRLAQALAARELPDAVYSSDLARARDTAQAVAVAAGLSVQTHAGLRERGFGDFEGQTFTDLETSRPEDTERWRRREPTWAPPGGETLLALRERVLGTVAELAGRHLGQQLLLVTHGGAMDVLYRAATGLDLQAARTWSLGNAAINRLLWTPDGLTMVGWADDAHLDAAWRDEATA